MIIPTISSDISKTEILVDKASIFTDMRNQEQNIDVGQFETALGQLVNQQAKEVRNRVEDIRDLKVNFQIKSSFIYLFIYLFSRLMLKIIKKILKNFKQ